MDVIKKCKDKTGNLCGLEPQLIKLEFIIYLPKLKVFVTTGPLWGAQ